MESSGAIAPETILPAQVNVEIFEKGSFNRLGREYKHNFYSFWIPLNESHIRDSVILLRDFLDSVGPDSDVWTDKSSATWIQIEMLSDKAGDFYLHPEDLRLQNGSVLGIGFTILPKIEN